MNTGEEKQWIVGGDNDGKALVLQIQRFSIHDGPGIRTTVFFKGCPLRCAWCHNPESIHGEPQLLYHGQRCTGCGLCAERCPQGAVSASDPSRTDRRRCAACGSCALSCLNEAREIAGAPHTVEELLATVERDRMFYEQSGGGVTLSGGEVLAQPMAFVEDLVSQLHSRECPVAVDTCGFVPYDHFVRLLPYAPVFLYDLKILDTETHRRWTGRDNRLILENLERLSSDGGEILLRIPVVNGVNGDGASMEAMARWLREREIRLQAIHLLPHHNTGTGKWEQLGVGMPMQFTPPGTDMMEQARSVFLQGGFPRVVIGG